MTDDPRVVAVVQARMGSTRFPGKSLACLGDRPVIEHVLRRVSRTDSVETVVLATSDRDQDTALASVADDLGFACFRGSETDVLGRVWNAASNEEADVVVRVCADNPLVAPEEIDRAVRQHLRADGDYSFNHVPAKGNGYPDGFGAEVLDMTALNDLERRATEPDHREHVTAYIWDNESAFDIETVPAPEPLTGLDIELDLDTASDYTRLRRLFEYAPSDVDGWKATDIADTYQRRVIQ